MDWDEGWEHLNESQRRRAVNTLIAVYMSQLDQLRADCERYIAVDEGSVKPDGTTSDWEMAKIRRRLKRGMCDIVKATGPYVWLAMIGAMMTWFEEAPTAIYGENQSD